MLPRLAGALGLALGCLALALALGACGSEDGEDGGAKADAAATDDAPTAPALPPAQTLTCQPDTLAPGDTLRMRMPTPHGDDLLVEDPDGTVYFAFQDGAASPFLAPAPAMPAAGARGFGNLGVLALPLDSLEMKPYAYDARSAVRVFRKPGAYTWRVGTGLPAQGPDPLLACTIVWQPAAG